MQRTKNSCYHLIFAEISRYQPWGVGDSMRVNGRSRRSLLFSVRGSGVYFGKRSISSFTARRLSQWRAFFVLVSVFAFVYQPIIALCARFVKMKIAHSVIYNNAGKAKKWADENPPVFDYTV